MSRFLILIPCYNEAERLAGEKFVVFAQANPQFTFCFINDGSTDGTTGLLDELVVQLPTQLEALHLSHNCGKGEAIRQAVHAATTTSKAEWIGYLDADLATPLEELRRVASLCDTRPELRLITGLRLARLGANIERGYRRHFFGRIIATAVSRILGIGVYDTQCGAKLIRKEDCIFLFEKPFLSRWLFDVELFARQQIALGRKQMLATSKEIPLETWSEVGESKVSLGSMLRVPGQLWRIWWRYRKKLREAAHT